MVNKISVGGVLPAPVKQDRHGLAWDRKDVMRGVAKHITMEGGNYFQQRMEYSMDDIEKAAETCDGAIKMLETKVDRLIGIEDKLSAASKKASSGVRKAADDLNSGAQKLEKLANLDRLERMVSVLERAASALTTLAELEKEGKLDKIAGVLGK